MPAAEMVDGLLILIGGVVLITPGLLTDLCGFALMVPAVRRTVRTRIEERFGMMATQRSKRAGADVIDV